MITMLHCDHERGSINLHAETIDGVQVPVRRYIIQDHTVVLDGIASVVQHDVQAILSNPNGEYRLPTPTEQEAYAATQRAKTMIQEGGGDA